MTGPVLGAGSLDQREKDLVARIHTVVVIEPGTVMTKVLRPGSFERYMQREVSPGVWGHLPPFDFRVVGGTVARQQDCTELRTPAALIRAFRLDYPGTTFDPRMPVIHAMEFAVVRTAEFVKPLGAPSAPYPPIGFPENLPYVRLTADEMVNAAEAAGVDPNSYRREIRPWPYTGTGLTAADELAVPEWWRRFGPQPFGSVIYQHDSYGNKTPLAVFRGDFFGWDLQR